MKINQISRVLLIFVLLQLSNTLLKVLKPDALKQYVVKKYDLKGIPYSIANFGDVPYGRNLIAQVEFPRVLQNCIYQDIPSQNKTKKFILSERNDCKFTQKALNTQNQGGIMSIIMDNIVQNPNSIIMVDDGHGSQIHIPTILISQQDGQKILQQTEKVILAVYFNTTKTDEVSINLFLDINDRGSFIFLRKFQPYFQKLKNRVKLSINYATITCTKCSADDCFYNGTYCKKIIPPYYYANYDNKGQQVIREQLRQYFIYKQYPSLWWSYMLRYDDYCSSKYGQQYLVSCSKGLMNDLGINYDKISNLTNTSFGNDTNSILESAMKQRANSQVMYYPTIVINNITYRGNLQAFEVEEMICNSLNNPPDSCNENPYQSKSDHIVMWVIISILGFLILVGFIILCYRRIVRRQISNNMNKQVNELVNQYITMYEADKFKGDQQLLEKNDKE